MKNLTIGLGVLLGGLAGVACSSDAAPLPMASSPTGSSTSTAPGGPSGGPTTTAPVTPGQTPSVPGSGPITPGAPTPGSSGPTVPGEVPQPTPTATTPTTEPQEPGAAACSNTDTTTLPIDETAWINRECTDFGIQGAWYCYDDGVNQSGCPADSKPYVAGRGMCLTGSTTEDELAWGAGIGLSLNESGEVDGMASVKSPFDAAAAGIIGFEITIEGDTGGNEIRVAFKVNEVDDVAPFDDVPGADTYEVLIANAEVPSAWEVPNAGAVADPTSLLDIQIQIAGGTTNADYDFCITKITPITDGSAPQPGAGAVATYGQEICGQYDTIDIGPFSVHNNRYGGNGHCIQALWDNGNQGGFRLSNVSADVETGSAPGSYPALIHGWHVDGSFYGGYPAARQLSAITSIPSTLDVSVPGAGNSYNTAYDNWIASTANPGGPAGTLEQMIWINYQDTTPIGTQVDTASLAGTSWEVWYGTHDGFSTVSYIRATNVNSIDFDMKEFMDDTVQRGYASASDYLLGIQAGFEIWRSTSPFSVDSYTVSVD